MTNNLISVIVPVYKTDEPSLRRSIESVLAQTYTCLELILVDDGSPDNSGDICEEYKLKDKRICVIHQNNEGVSSARNTGLSIARGEYISFVDSDDYVDSNYLETLLYVLQNEKSDIAICCCYSNKDKCDNEEMVTISCNRSKALDVLSYNKHIFYNCETNCVWGKLYTRDTIKSIRFDEKMCIAEDYIFNYFATSNARNVTYLNKQLYHYITTPSSISNAGTDKKYIKSFDALASYGDKNDRGMINRILTVAFWVLLRSNQNSKTVCLHKYIRDNYFSVLFDPKSSVKTRIALLAYPFGERFLKSVYKLSSQ